MDCLKMWILSMLHRVHFLLVAKVLTTLMGLPCHRMEHSMKFRWNSEVISSISGKLYSLQSAWHMCLT
jgi:hypothetical protein